jgi:cyclic pyranopterin phosphate synthase
MKVAAVTSLAPVPAPISHQPSVPAAAAASALTDRFGRRHNYLRISVTDRCNLRCVYCMPAEGLVWKERTDILSYEEIERLAALFVRLGVDKIRLTGGEPTVRRNLHHLIGRLRGLSGLRTLLMSTNGVLLAKEAAGYRAAGLDALNISLDTLQAERFEKMTLRASHAAVLAGIEAALQAGFAAIKVNVVVMAGINDDELVAFTGYAAARPLEVRFIEFMPFDRNDWSASRIVPYAEMRRRIESVYRLTPIDPAPNAVAKEFAIGGGIGRVGFVTSMTENFCASCNRLRLTADGKLKNCLFSTTESDLREPMRAGATDAELTTIIRQSVLGKWAGHPPMDVLAELGNRSMIQIGG